MGRFGCISVSQAVAWHRGSLCWIAGGMTGVWTLPYSRSWFYDTKLYWAECSWPCNVHITYGERFVYCLVLGFYVQVCVGL